MVGSAVTNRPRLSLLQMMKLVAYCAVTSACVAPMWRLWRIGAIAGGTVQDLVGVVLLEGVVLPLVWAGLSVVLVHRGAWRDRLIAALLLWSISLALAIAWWTFYRHTLPAYAHGWPHGTADRVLAANVLAIVTLTASALFLLRRLWRG
jgi:hypothetical protein